MQIRAGKIGVVVAAAALAAMAFGATGAEGAKLKTRTATTTVPPGAPTALGTASATAVCPRGTRIVGGGFLGTFSFSGGTSLALPYESFRVGQRRWRVSGENIGLLPQQLTSYAYCRDVPRISQRAETIFLPPDPATPTFGTAGVNCPRGKRAIAGGFRAQPLDAVTENGAIPLISRRAGSRSWLTSATTEDDSHSGSLTTLAYCLDRPKPKRRSGSASVSGDNAPGSARTSLCPRGTFPAAGGFDQSPLVLTGANQNAFLFFESRRVGRRWQVSGYHVEAAMTTTINITVHGYCS